MGGAGSGLAKFAGGPAVLDGANGGRLERAAQGLAYASAVPTAEGATNLPVPWARHQERGRSMWVNSQIDPRESRRTNDSAQGELLQADYLMAACVEPEPALRRPRAETMPRRPSPQGQRQKSASAPRRTGRSHQHAVGFRIEPPDTNDYGGRAMTYQQGPWHLR